MKNKFRVDILFILIGIFISVFSALSGLVILITGTILYSKGPKEKPKSVINYNLLFQKCKLSLTKTSANKFKRIKIVFK